MPPIDVEQANAEIDALLKGAVTSLKQPIEEPNYNKVDTSGLKRKIEKVDTQAEVANLQIGVERDRFNAANAEEQRAILARGQAEADLAIADQEKAKQEADLTLEIANALGVNPSDIAAVGEKLRTERPKAEAMLREIQQRQSTSPIDNPLEWITSRLTMKPMIDGYNRQADIVNSLEQTLSDSLGTAQSAAAFANRTVPAISAAQAAAKAKALVAESQKLAAQADEKLALQNVTFAQQRLANDLAVAGLTKESTAQDLQQANAEFQAAIQKIAFADSHANRQLKAAELLDKLNRTKSMDVLLENYDRIIGNPKGTTNRYTFEKFGEAQRTNMVAIGAGSGGTDPYQALVNLTGSGIRPGPLFTSGRLLGSVRDWAAEIGADPKIQLLDEKQKPLMIGKKLSERIELEKQSAYKPGNIFYELSPKEMILSGNVDKDSQLAKVLEPFATQEGNIPTGVVVAAIENQWKNPAEAGAVLSDYYKKNMLLRNSTQNYRLVGVVPDAGYKVPISVGPFGDRMKLDITQPQDATKMILFMRKNKMIGEAFQDVSHGTFGRFN